MLDGFSAEILARFQFAFTVSFHIIFPSFSIGLASYLAVLNGLWMRTRDETYLTLFNYWKKIFAVAFGMGVVSGIVMSYQFGTNWSVFSDKAGPVVVEFLNMHIITPCQHGFISTKSIETASYHLLDSIYNDPDEGNYVMSLMFDLHLIPSIYI